MENQIILFPNDDAIIKYNIDKNGLYLNDELGYNEYSSPYFGVSVRNNKYHPTFNLTKDIEEKLKSNSIVLEATRKGFNYFDKNNRFPIILNGYDDPRSAAYIAQMYRFSENSEELIVDLIRHLYIEFDSEVDRLLNEIPYFFYEPVTGVTYNPNDKSFHIIQKKIDESKARILERKQQLIKNKQQRRNANEFLERMKKYADKIGYKYDVMTEELATKLMRKKFN